MWKLTIEDDEGKQTSLPLAHEEYALGRAEENAIRLTDRNVSRKHAILHQNGQGWLIRDLSSYNGTYVNGVRVAGEQHVTSGDVVQLGDYRLELIDEATLQAAADPLAGSVGPLPVHHRPDRLVMVVGPTPGAEFPLDRDYFSVGRAEDATISINHSSVSRLHAELIALGGGRFEIVDKQSANGIRINGVELKRGILEAGDALELGDVRLRFVGAGKIFRPGADQSQQLRAVGTFESVAPSVRAPAPATGVADRGGIAKFVGIGLVVGLLAIGAIVYAMRSTATPGPDPRPTPSTSPNEPVGLDALREAEKLAAKGDLDGAHAKLQTVPEGSSVREEASFREIEGKWADSMFQKAEATKDATERRRILNLISSTTTVDLERRNRAANMLQSVEPAPTPDPGPRAPNPGPAAPQPAAGNQASTGTAAAPTQTPSATPAALPPPMPGGNLENDAIIKSLQGKVFSGKASEAEIKMLKSACSAAGNRACRDKAAAMLKKKQDEGK